MRPWISVGVLAFFLLTASNAFAEGKLEKRLMKEGWVKLTTKELKALKDFTGTNDLGEAEYVDPSGTKVVTRNLSGTLEKGTRKINPDGQFCHYYEGALTIPCWSLWRRGKYYLSVGYNVMSGGSESDVSLNIDWQFTIKPGNTENL